MMLIGKLAERTGTSERLLRYYESVGLLTAARRPNGYRTYDETAPQTVGKIRALLAAGLPTSTIRQVLPCTEADAAAGATVRPCPGVLDGMRAHLAELDRRAAELASARETLRRTIATTEGLHPPVEIRTHPRADASGVPRS
jgi:DNA-binding transcriptional MerR regulator